MIRTSGGLGYAMIVAAAVVVVGMAAMVAASVAGLLSNLSTYQAHLTDQVAGLREALESRGIEVPPNALAGVIDVGAIMS
jgi:hypothetical protein